MLSPGEQLLHSLPDHGVAPGAVQAAAAPQIQRRCRAHQNAGFSLYYLSPKDFADRIDERERFNHSLLPSLFAA